MKRSQASTSSDWMHKKPRVSSSPAASNRCSDSTSTSDQMVNKKQIRSSSPSPICNHNIIVLPDDLVFEILLWLPVTSVIKFRLVCRSWHLRLTDPSFMEAHNRRSPMSSVVAFPWYLTNSTLLDLHRFDHHRGINTVQITIPRDETGCFVNSTLKYIGSFDAMVCVAKTHDHDYFYVFNLLTKERMIVPSQYPSRFLALYHHQPSGEYRLLSLHWPTSRFPQDRLWVFSLKKSNKSTWRQIDDIICDGSPLS